MCLIYVAPPLSRVSFAQRPHKFAHWFHTRTRRDVVWCEPCPTRISKLSDLRPCGQARTVPVGEHPAWLKVLPPRALPIEPWPKSAWMNGCLWASLIDESKASAARGKALAVVGVWLRFCLLSAYHAGCLVLAKFGLGRG